jgi:YegS/Rv2252/BmrU family lipid kinase
MSLPLVIVNPESASGATAKAWPGIASDLGSHFGPFKPAFTERPGHARELASDAARKGTQLIIACGGDGTVSEVANGILLSGKDAELGIMPSGTGGDFRKTLRISSRSNDAARVLKQGVTRKIDVGRVTFMTAVGEKESRYFLGVASFGMSAEVIERVKENQPEWLPAAAPGWLRGRWAFSASMIRTALQSPSTRVLVQLDDNREKHLTVANLCVANARYFGGGMKIAPDAKLNDGKFDVITIGDLGATKIVTNAPRLYLGWHVSMNEVGHILAEKITARPAEKSDVVPIEIDGELLGRLPATFQILPEALRVRCPRKND